MHRVFSTTCSQKTPYIPQRKLRRPKEQVASCFWLYRGLYYPVFLGIEKSHYKDPRQTNPYNGMLQPFISLMNTDPWDVAFKTIFPPISGQAESQEIYPRGIDHISTISSPE